MNRKNIRLLFSLKHLVTIYYMQYLRFEYLLLFRFVKQEYRKYKHHIQGVQINEFLDHTARDEVSTWIYLYYEKEYIEEVQKRYDLMPLPSASMTQ